MAEVEFCEVREGQNLGLERSGGIAMASMSFKLSLLLLFLLWGLKPTFLESCSRVWKWTQSFVFFFFCGFLYFQAKGDLQISNNPGGLYFCCFWAFILQNREMYDFICFWIISHVTLAMRRKGLGQERVSHKVGYYR